MKIVGWILLLEIVTVVACGARPSKKIPGGSVGGGGDNPSGDGGTGDSVQVPGGYAPSPGSAMRLIDGNALSQIYARVFPLRSYGFEICKKDDVKKYRSITDCSDSLFTNDERPFVGTMGLNTPDLNRGTQNLRLPEDLTLNYMRTLRVGLSRECEARVAIEWEALSQGNPAGNFLIKAEQPTKESIEEFFRRIIGVEGTKLPVDIDAEAYLTAFKTVQGGKSDPNSMKVAYYGLCIAVAMDPQIFIY